MEVSAAELVGGKPVWCFALGLWRRRRNAGAVHEHDLPGAFLFLQEGRFQPLLGHGSRGIADAAFIDVGDLSSIAGGMDIRLAHVPFVALASGML